MRYKLTKAGTLRTRSRFLWLPKTIRDEWRWLERARWEERAFGEFARDWIPVRWLDEEKKTPYYIGVYDERAVVDAVARMGKAEAGE